MDISVKNQGDDHTGNDWILEVEHLTKVYAHIPAYTRRSIKDIFSHDPRGLLRQEAVTALQDVSFKLAKGESLGVIGQNGAGKSTLLKILSGITKPTSGEARIYGKTLSILDIGTGFHPDLTGRENVFLSGEILGMSRQQIEDKFDEIVRFSGIAPFIDLPVKYYSNGMYLRLAFSLVVNLDADLLLFDEMLSVGDKAFQAKSLQKLYEMAERNRSFILVSHNMHEIANLCNRVIVLENGRITREGNVYEVLKYYSVSPAMPLTTEPETGQETPAEKGEVEQAEEGSSPEDTTITGEQPAGGEFFKLISVKAYTNHNEETKIFNPGEPIKMEIKFLINTDEEIDVGFSVSDMLETRLFGGGTQLIPGFKSAKGTYCLQWQLKENCLNSGRFKISLYVFHKGKVSQHLHDVFDFEIAGEGIVINGQNFYVPLKPDLHLALVKIDS